MVSARQMERGNFVHNVHLQLHTDVDIAVAAARKVKALFKLSFSGLMCPPGLEYHMGRDSPIGSRSNALQAR